MRIATGGMDRLGHPIDHHVGEQLIFAETLFHVAIAVAPRTELLHDPGSQADRRVVQAVGQGLWFARLNHRIRTLLEEPALVGTQILLLGRGEIRLPRIQGVKAEVRDMDAGDKRFSLDVSTLCSIR
jgi:hypothetical protein